MANADLICPKCQSPMRSQERNGITIDRCTSCGGIFLDRGELERLIDLETSSYAAGPGPRGEDDYEERSEHGRYPRRRRRGLLGDLFDLG